MITPLNDYISVKVDETKTTTESGILIVGDGNPNQTITGTVIAIGPGEYDKKGNRVPLQVAVDDVIVFGKGVGIKMEDFGITMMREKEIITVVT